jgi:hypothetical protein
VHGAEASAPPPHPPRNTTERPSADIDWRPSTTSMNSYLLALHFVGLAAQYSGVHGLLQCVEPTLMLSGLTDTRIVVPAPRSCTNTSSRLKLFVS